MHIKEAIDIEFENSEVLLLENNLNASLQTEKEY